MNFFVGTECFKVWCEEVDLYINTSTSTEGGGNQGMTMTKISKFSLYTRDDNDEDCQNPNIKVFTVHNISFNSRNQTQEGSFTHG